MSLHKVLLLKLQVVAYQVKEANLDCNILNLSFCGLVCGVKINGPSSLVHGKLGIAHCNVTAP